jgi:hypothetical protein
MQLDADEDGAPFGAHAPPAGVTASPPAAAKSKASDEEDRPLSADSAASDDVRAAARLTGELEE